MKPEKRLEDLYENYNTEDKLFLLHETELIITKFGYNIHALRDHSFISHNISTIAANTDCKSDKLRKILHFYYLVLAAQAHRYIESEIIETIIQGMAGKFIITLRNELLKLSNKQGPLDIEDYAEFCALALVLDRADIIQICIDHGLSLPEHPFFSNIAIDPQYNSHTKKVFAALTKPQTIATKPEAVFTELAVNESNTTKKNKISSPPQAPRVLEQFEVLTSEIQKLNSSEFNRIIKNDATLLDKVKNAFIGKISEKTKKHEEITKFIKDINLPLNYVLTMYQQNSLNITARELLLSKIISYPAEDFFTITDELTLNLDGIYKKLRDDISAKIKENRLWLEKQIKAHQAYIIKNPNNPLNEKNQESSIYDGKYFKHALQKQELLENMIWKKIISIDASQPLSDEHHQLIAAFKKYVSYYELKIATSQYNDSIFDIAAKTRSPQLLAAIVQCFRSELDAIASNDKQILYHLMKNSSQDCFEKLLELLTPEQFSAAKDVSKNEATALHHWALFLPHSHATFNRLYSLYDSEYFHIKSHKLNGATFIHTFFLNEETKESEGIALFEKIFLEYDAYLDAPNKVIEEKDLEYLKTILLSEDNAGNSLYTIAEMREWNTLAEYTVAYTIMLFEILCNQQDADMIKHLNTLADILNRAPKNNIIVKKFNNREYDDVIKHMNLRINFRISIYHALKTNEKCGIFAANILKTYEYAEYILNGKPLFSHIFDYKNNEIPGIIKIRESNCIQLLLPELSVSSLEQWQELCNEAVQQKKLSQEIKQKIEQFSQFINNYRFNLSKTDANNHTIAEDLVVINNPMFTEEICTKIKVKITPITLIYLCSYIDADIENIKYMFEKYNHEQEVNNNKNLRVYPEFYNIYSTNLGISLDLLGLTIFNGSNKTKTMQKIEFLLNMMEGKGKTYAHSEYMIIRLLANINCREELSFNYVYNVMKLLVSNPAFKAKLKFIDSINNTSALKNSFKIIPKNAEEEEVFHKILSLIFENGCDIASLDIYNNNILHYAFFHNANIATIKFLFHKIKTCHSQDKLESMLTQKNTDPSIMLNPIETISIGNEARRRAYNAAYLNEIKKILTAEGVYISGFNPTEATHKQQNKNYLKLML